MAMLEYYTKEEYKFEDGLRYVKNPKDGIWYLDLMHEPTLKEYEKSNNTSGSDEVVASGIDEVLKVFDENR